MSLFSKRAADIVLLNGVVYTADDADTVHEAVAVKDTRIVFVGSNEDVCSYIGEKTKTLDLLGKMVIPGMIDSHIHPPGLSLMELYEVQVFGLHSREEYVAAVKKFIDEHPDCRAVYGRGWSWDVFSGEELSKGPRREYLDAVTTDVPVVLRANDGHTLWLNSKALEVNGITENTQTPPGGVIERDFHSGKLWGTLKESAMWLVALPEYSTRQYMEAMASFQTKMHRFGITGIFCMASLIFKMIYEACGELIKQGNLQLWVRGAMTVNPHDDLTAQIDAINAMRRKYNTPYLQVTAAKFFTDGVIEGGTGHLLAPYTVEAGKGPNHYGDFLWDEKKLKRAFFEANKNGLQVHVHSTGDASTKKVLDALDFVQTQLPNSDVRNTITHLQLVDKNDIPRFKELNVVASVQPYWHFKGPKWWHRVDFQFLGERAEEEFPLGIFFANGIKVASSSDYPATVVPNPLRAIDIGATRNIDNGSFYGLEDITDMDDSRYLLNKNERASVQQMIKSFTIYAAYALFLDKETGSIEVGKFADLAVLDRNIFRINPADIDKAKVVMTFFNGKLVYRDPSCSSFH
ncbi:MAG: amidohydrolase [Negativicutes bacterium]